MTVEAGFWAIIGGSVAGAFVLIVIIAIVVYLLCGKRRRKKERDQKKFHQLTPHTSPTHSQPSSLSHGPHPLPGSGGGDPRLPKVSSNGLWVGAPGIYAATPSPAYYYGRPGAKPHHLMQPAVMQRASSETRLATSHNRGQVSGSPAVYATGGSQQRIYHSQQLAGLTPLYEVVDPVDGSIYDVYQIGGGGGGSKTKLLQEGGKSSERLYHQYNNHHHNHNHHNHNHHHHKGGKRLERSQSDVGSDPEKRQSRNRPSSHDPRLNAAAKQGSVVKKEKAQVHEIARAHSSGGGKQTGVENPAFHGDGGGEKIIVENGEEKVQVVAAVVASATDSMKLLAKNKTDDQKTTVAHSSSGSSTPAQVPIDEKLQPKLADGEQSLHYTSHAGDIYAVPDKEEARRRSRSDNPILARMQDMINERSDGVPSISVKDPITDITETAEPLLITPREADSSFHSGSTHLIQNPIYQEVEEVRREENEGLNTIRTSSEYAARELSAAREPDGEGGDGAGALAAGSSGDVVVNDVAAASAVSHLVDAGASGGSGGDSDHHQHQQQKPPDAKGPLEPKWSTDTDGATDELSRAGKHISVTAEAFEFLDTYLSDEDVGDISSPPKSPVLSDQNTVQYYDPDDQVDKNDGLAVTKERGGMIY